MVCLTAVLTATSTLAAPPLQDSTPTATSTRIPLIGPTWTITPTMLPLPQNGGRVIVQAAAVRIAPFPTSPSLGSIPYNSEVHGLGRSANGSWIAVNWENTDIGWVLEEIILWHPDFDVTTLPVLIPPFDEAALLVTTTPTTVPATNTAAPTDAAATEAPPSATQTPAPTETATVTELPSETPVPAVAEVNPNPTTEPEPTAPPPSTTPPMGGYLPFVGIGVPIILLLGLYGWQFARGQREVSRYAKTFPLANCPVCQWGALSLDETIQRPLGIAHVTRTVRCDTCRSVLRQVDAGEWRYAIDPYINPQLAAEYDGKTFDDNRLREFVATAAAYPPAVPQTDVPPPLTDEEIMADLEARIPVEEVVDEAAVSEEVDVIEAVEGEEPPSEDEETE